MTEVFSEKVKNIDGDHSISVLFLATKWQFDTYGLSTVNKSLVNNLREADPEGMKIKIPCAVVEEEGKIKDDQRQEATKLKVELRGAKQPRGSKQKPSIEWLDQNIATFYPDLRESSYDFIIGHVPYLANGPLNFRDNYVATKTKPKVILMIHNIPKTTDMDRDEDILLEWLSEADVIFSVGEKVESEIISCIRSLAPEKRPIHKLYIPSYPLELFNVYRDDVQGNKVCGTQNVAMMTGESKDLTINWLDFPLAVASTSGASKHILNCDGVKTNFTLLTNNEEDKEEWRREFSELAQKEKIKGKSLHFQPDTPNTLEKMKNHMRKSNLFLLPLKPDSPLFGTEALSAVAAGVPILVSSHSGMASILVQIQGESVVRDSSFELEKETWKNRILEKLLRPEESQRAANNLREQLRLDSGISQTHLDFKKTIAEASCVRLEVELDSDPVVASENINTGVRFGVDISNQKPPLGAKKYVLAFIHKLLLQRKKLRLGILKDYLGSGITILWHKVLETLESCGRMFFGH